MLEALKDPKNALSYSRSLIRSMPSGALVGIEPEGGDVNIGRAGNRDVTGAGWTPFMVMGVRTPDNVIDVEVDSETENEGDGDGETGGG